MFRLSNTDIARGLGAMTLILVASTARAQHTRHQMAPAQPAARGPSQEAVAACVQAQQRINAIAEAGKQRLEAARQTNSAADMREAVDDLQAALVEIESQSSACAQLQAAAATGEEHAGHAMGSVPQGPATPPAAPVKQPGSQQPATAAPTEHSRMGHAMPLPVETIDPVCGRKVDPKTAPKETYKGHTYFFCSEKDRARFLKDPEKYLKKPPE